MATVKPMEDEDHTLLFVDMLGFAALTREHPKRVVRYVTKPSGFIIDSTTPTPGRMNRFQSALETLIYHERRYGGLQAMIFSDCAFLDFGPTLRTALAATTLMRTCIGLHVPVRMGLGKGTFYQMNYAMESDGTTTVTQSRFMGTAVVAAHAAEQCGGKGMRIFVHPSVEPDLPSIRLKLHVLNLRQRFREAHWELDYLLEEEGKAPAGEDEVTTDRELFEAVAAMNRPEFPAKVKRQYTDTFRALNRMRKAHSRREIVAARISPKPSLWY